MEYQPGDLKLGTRVLLSTRRDLLRKTANEVARRT